MTSEPHESSEQREAQPGQSRDALPLAQRQHTSAALCRPKVALAGQAVHLPAWMTCSWRWKEKD